MGVAVLSRVTGRLQAALPLGLAPGLQLWSVRADLSKDDVGTLREIAAIGYRELELYRMPPSPAEFRRKCEDAGLKLMSGHFDMPLERFGSQETIDGAKAMGLQYMVVVFPTLRALAGSNAARLSFSQQNAEYEKISLDEYKWNAEQFNVYGERVKNAGMQLAYHNHALDLKTLDGVVALDALIAGTDPNLVVFEMDCGHVIHAGADPIAYLQKYPNRIGLLHLKDLKPGYSTSTTLDTETKDTNAEIGAGVIDWKRLFGVIKPGSLKHWFVEHEGRMEHPPMESIAISYNFLRQM